MLPVSVWMKGEGAGFEEEVRDIVYSGMGSGMREEELREDRREEESAKRALRKGGGTCCSTRIECQPPDACTQVGQYSRVYPRADAVHLVRL